jgi:putative phosphoesterase
MRLGLISDIHGNYEALKAVLGEFERIGVDEIFCLGDVVGYYPQINECCDALRNRGIKSLMGNHDWYLAGGGFCPRSKSVNDCLAYKRELITEENLQWLGGFLPYAQFNQLNLVHGGWCDPIDEYLTDPTENYFKKVRGTVFTSGHTHIQSLHVWEKKMYCNPGSVGQPRDGDPRAAFAIFDGTFELFRVEYDMQPVFEIMNSLGYSDYYYGCLKTGARNLCKLENSKSE